MYKRRKLEGLRPLFSLFFGSAHPHSSKIYYPLFFLIKLAIPPKKKKRLPREISIASDMQMTPPLGQKVKRNYQPLDESKIGK